MQTKSLNNLILRLRICIIAFILALLALLLLSFTVVRTTDNLFNQLGISKVDADHKISTSIIGGYFNAYGIKHIKAILPGSRRDLTADLLTYVKKYVNEPAFKTEYAKLKSDAKPQLTKVQTPDEMRNETIAMYRKSVRETEDALKTATGDIKPIFQKALDDARKQLKQLENPDNKTFDTYTRNYPQILKSANESYVAELAEWERLYPANHLLFVKERLSKFLTETANIDFEAVLVEKNGKKLFSKPEYEHKSGYWKMAFRAGKEVVEPARAFVEKWMEEIK